MKRPSPDGVCRAKYGRSSKSVLAAVVAHLVDLVWILIPLLACPLVLRGQGVPPTADTVPAAGGEKGETPGCAEPSGTDCRKEAVAVPVTPGAINVDGVLTEEAWASASFITGFTQKDPEEGSPATEPTRVAFLFDRDALYVGARMLSSEAGRIRSIMSRRDVEATVDQLVISLDTYRDRRTAYSFAVTAAGGRLDWFHPKDSEGSRDFVFDPVWEASTSIDSLGWTAEIRIPFSQLRFRSGKDQRWGLNVMRHVPTVNESDYWVLVPKTETGWASRFGDLVGIEEIGSVVRLEVLPYVAGLTTLTSGSLVEADDPFADAEEWSWRGGLDLKLGLGPNFTIDATFNPDFNQVEADPAEVNLTAYETFFEERRPFFTEAKDLFEGEGPDFFYSRRIGAEPHGDAEGDFEEETEETTILGATKLTGRTNGGLSLALLGAVTDQEVARGFDLSGDSLTRTVVEPTATYGALRMQQQFGESGSTVGLTGTLVRRDVGAGDPLATIVGREAYGGGADWKLRFGGGHYELKGSFGGSHVAGDTAAIRRLQTSSRRYYQRPDADHVELDPTLLSLQGYAAELNFAKNSGNVRFGLGGSGESPGFEINDAGRQRSADNLSANTWLEYRLTRPSGALHAFSAELGASSDWNFGGVRTSTSSWLTTYFTFRDFSELWLEGGASARALSDSRTRGGPLMGTEARWYATGGFSTDARARTRLSASGWYERDELGGWNYYLNGSLEVDASERFQFSLGPYYQREVAPRQFVAILPGGSASTFGDRYVFAFTDRSNLSAELRMSLSITPDLSLEAYAESFAGTGTFYDHGELRAARSRELRTYGTEGTTIELERDEEGEPLQYVVTDGDDRFTLPFQDFNFLSFQSNAVLRWEWTPGSTLFLVWQRDRSDSQPLGNLARPRQLIDSLSASGENSLLLKITYWIPIG